MLGTIAAFIHLNSNSLRAGMLSDLKDYQWRWFGDAANGEQRALRDCGDYRWRGMCCRRKKDSREGDGEVSGVAVGTGGGEGENDA